MKHCVIVKLKPEVPDKKKIISEAFALFKQLENQNGIHEVEMLTNCVDRSNRYDFVIRITMERESLDFYDNSPQHLKWKSDYSQFIESKAIFDY